MFDLSRQRLRNDILSPAPAQFADPARFWPLTKALEFYCIETADPDVREAWVKNQLGNLIAHAAAQSRFWKKRLRRASRDLKSVPILTRADLVEQVGSEGPLSLSGVHGQITSRATAGSVGKKVTFFSSDMNGAYNGVRGVAQFLFRDRPLTGNLVSLSRGATEDEKGFVIASRPHWAGPFAQIFENGGLREVILQFPDYARLGEELSAQRCDYVAAPPSHFQKLAEAMGPRFGELGVVQFNSLGQEVSPSVRHLCEANGVSVADSYSCEEVGPIGYECAAQPGMFHIVTSNVIVESVAPFVEIEGRQAGRIIVTHLHSYATPFIRYEVGDLGILAQTCPCGHKGPTLSRLFGRTAAFLRKENDVLIPFLLGQAHIDPILSTREWRVRQVALDRLIFEVVPQESVTDEKVTTLQQLLRGFFGDELTVDIDVVAAIDWGESYKRLMFRCEI